MSIEAHIHWASFVFFCDIVQLVTAVNNPSKHSIVLEKLAPCGLDEHTLR